jgi:hypothetical protein
MKVKMNSSEFLIGLGLIMIIFGSVLIGMHFGIISKY